MTKRNGEFLNFSELVAGLEIASRILLSHLMEGLCGRGAQKQRGCKMTAKEGGTRGQQMGKLLVFRWLSPENVLNVTLLNLALPFIYNSEMIINLKMELPDA